ncbi:uncharacterized protein LOC127720818 [Mytilus californianus]|uniref:uncharacterized protein LOC127720818 n=1 Tax=Mytilus californianus TaxID=6549 RepID=UPI002245938C|nr:uncharacterized protein LOC127720818 [Mytilus californianus]
MAMHSTLICLVRFFVSVTLILDVTCECSFDSSTDCMNQAIKKDCFCSCLEAKLDAYYTTQLKVQANYLCTHFLKECKDIWTLSFSYTVVNISTLNEELYTSERILVPHDQEIITEIKELEIAGKYSIKIKPSCTICGSGCKVIHLSSIQIKKGKVPKKSKAKQYLTDFISLPVLVTFVCVLVIGILLIIILTQKNERHWNQIPVSEIHI